MPLVGGRGKGREVGLVGSLTGLSLAMYETLSLHIETPLHDGKQNPVGERSECTQIVLIRQGNRGISAYQAPEECIREPGRYCSIKGTQVKYAEWAKRCCV